MFNRDADTVLGRASKIAPWKSANRIHFRIQKSHVKGPAILDDYIRIFKLLQKILENIKGLIEFFVQRS